jgi:hypothetical protein
MEYAELKKKEVKNRRKNRKSTKTKVLVVPQLVLLKTSNLISCISFINYEIF